MFKKLLPSLTCVLIGFGFAIASLAFDGWFGWSMLLTSWAWYGNAFLMAPDAETN